MNRIDSKFRELKKNNKKAFIAFITAGYPSLEATEKLVLGFDRIGVDMVELGVPFSDPMADGAIIQSSSQYALESGVNTVDILALVRRLRKKTDIPICLMTYYNPVFCFPEKNFIEQAVSSGVDGLIIPDLPPEEDSFLVKYSRLKGLDTIFFITPTTTLERAKYISHMSKGFIYYVSLTGVTGQRKKLPKDITSNIKKIKSFTFVPVCVGFGVSNQAQVKSICRVADGVIVGSAIVSKIRDNIGRPGLTRNVCSFVRRLLPK